MTGIKGAGAMSVGCVRSRRPERLETNVRPSKTTAVRLSSDPRRESTAHSCRRCRGFCVRTGSLEGRGHANPSGGSIEIDDEHDHARMIYILGGAFELFFPGEAPTPLRT